MNICSVGGCDKNVRARGWCTKHWDRWRYTGDPTQTRTGITRDMTLEQRFDMKYEPVTESGCWIWTGASSKQGYGCIKAGRKNKQAHRVSYELHVGEIPDGMMVCHRCDTPSCVNPSHLFVGTGKDNIQDALSKGRMNIRRGAENNHSILTEIDVMDIRARRNEYARDLAQEYGVKKATIHSVWCRLTWSHI